ncbi:hypothetical protein ACOI2Q_11655 [Shewanella algae]
MQTQDKWPRVAHFVSLVSQGSANEAAGIIPAGNFSLPAWVL